MGFVATGPAAVNVGVTAFGSIIPVGPAAAAVGATAISHALARLGIVAVGWVAAPEGEAAFMYVSFCVGTAVSG